MRARQHVNPLGLSFETFSGEAPRLTPGRPVEVEVGCAEAQFLFERAAKEPERTYIGFEVRDHLVDEVNALAAEREAPVQAVFANANFHLRSLLPAESVDRVYLNFPDPWFKRRHRKRRMIDEELLRDIHHVMRPGGELLMQSDVWDVALDALAIIEGLEPMFDNRAGEWTFWKQGNPYGVRSWREQHCEAEGLPIWRIWYTRR